MHCRGCLPHQALADPTFPLNLAHSLYAFIDVQLEVCGRVVSYCSGSKAKLPSRFWFCRCM